jgi:hypothetical protein
MQGSHLPEERRHDRSGMPSSTVWSESACFYEIRYRLECLRNACEMQAMVDSPTSELNFNGSHSPVLSNDEISDRR